MGIFVGVKLKYKPWVCPIAQKIGFVSGLIVSDQEGFTSYLEGYVLEALSERN